MLPKTETPKRPTQRQVHKARTHKLLLATATRLFTEKGFDGATIRDIAAAMKMSTGSIFNSFSDKRALWVACMRIEPPTAEAWIEAISLLEWAIDRIDAFDCVSAEDIDKRVAATVLLAQVRGQ